MNNLHFISGYKMDLAVLEFGTIGSVDGWEALGFSHHAQHAQHRHSFVIKYLVHVPAI